MTNEFKYLPANTGEAYWMMGDTFTYLVTGAESGGSYFTLVVDVTPYAGPPPHVHHQEEEQFYVLDGELTFFIGAQVLQVRAGDFIHIPRGTVHSFKNGTVSSRLLATFSPAGIEDFFREAGEPVKDGLTPPPVNEETIARLLAAESNGWREHHETLPPPIP